MAEDASLEFRLKKLMKQEIIFEIKHNYLISKKYKKTLSI